MRSTRRTTLRTAAVVAGTAAVLALPVGSAFADSPAVPPTAGVRAFVTTVKLPDGSVAKVYKLGENHFEADLFAGSTKLDTLVGKGGAAAYGQNNGLHVVLQPNGTVTSWMEKPKPQVKPGVRKESSVRVTMPDGRIAKLVDGPRGKRVDLSMPNGTALGSIDLKHPSALNDGWMYKLVQDGKRVKFVVIDGKGGGSSWVYDFDGKLIEQYTARKDAKKDGARPAAVVGKAVPEGGAEAGAEGVAEPRGDTPKLVAAGGGMAAVGAAGLGFAMLRRRSS
ncbi:hypothetical protein [Streptomyces subrutilus]|uniref:hypothetical protein n=1 Tax=Streptomyces subrutilus TaxID=36818 RepID=UPI00340B5270